MKSSRMLATFVILAFAAWAGFALAGGEPAEKGQSESDSRAHPSSDPGKGAGHSQDRCRLHGGLIAMTEHHHFETLFTPDGIQIYMYNEGQAPMMIGRTIGGSVKLVGADGTTQETALVADLPKEGERAVYFCPMHVNVVRTTPGICPQCGGMRLYTQNRLFAKADLSKVEPGSLKAIVHVTGMKGPEKEVTFTETNNPPAPEAEAPKKG